MFRIDSQLCYTGDRLRSASVLAEAAADVLTSVYMCVFRLFCIASSAHGVFVVKLKEFW